MRPCTVTIDGVQDTIIKLGARYVFPYVDDDHFVAYTDGENFYDEGEFIEIVRIPLPELVEMIMRGEIEDAKTQTAILKVWNMKNK